MTDATTSRKIIHVDMDAFFASVEQRDRPALRGKPVAVGGLPEQRGVVAAASYEARRFGVRSAMPTVRALRLCPALVVVRPRFEVYRAVSLQIRNIMARFSDVIEPLSLDEAFLDVTVNKAGLATATETARALRTAIAAETYLTASAGIAPNKFLAKVASDIHKPNGQTTITPDMVDAFMRTLPVAKIYGIGPVTAERLAALGVHTAGDIQAWSREELMQRFGKAGDHYWHIARGIDVRPVEPNRRRKSVSAETTFAADLCDLNMLRGHLAHLAERVAERLAKNDIRGRTVTLKLRYGDFSDSTRSRTLDSWINDTETLIRTGCELLRATEAGTRPVRLLGLGVHNLDIGNASSDVPDTPQLRLAF